MSETKLSANLQAKDVAVELGVDISTVRRWADAGRFGKVTHGPGPRGRGYLTVKRRAVERVKAELADSPDLEPSSKMGGPA